MVSSRSTVMVSIVFLASLVYLLNWLHRCCQKTLTSVVIRVPFELPGCDITWLWGVSALFILAKP